MESSCILGFQNVKSNPSITSKTLVLECSKFRLAVISLLGELPVLLLRAQNLFSFLLTIMNSWLLLTPKTPFLLPMTSSNKFLSSCESWTLLDLVLKSMDRKRCILLCKSDPFRVGDLVGRGFDPLSLCLTKKISWWSNVTNSRMYRSVFCLSAW